MQTEARQYIERLWNFVLIPFLVDLATSAAVVAIVALLAAAFVLVGGNTVGVRLRHVTAAAAILECIYGVVVLVRTVWRHWRLVGMLISEDISPQQEGLEESARHPTSSD
jgi:hypothetical protein